jgi:hypothetical protein
VSRSCASAEGLLGFGAERLDPDGYRLGVQDEITMKTTS